MPRVVWPLLHARPRVEIALVRAIDGQLQPRRLLADTGAGSFRTNYELLLSEADCLMCGGVPIQPVLLGGAFTGVFPVCLISVEVPGLRFSANLRAVAVSNPLPGFDGIACYRFLNQFHFGNFGQSHQFGLES